MVKPWYHRDHGLIRIMVLRPWSHEDHGLQDHGLKFVLVPTNTDQVQHYSYVKDQNIDAVSIIKQLTQFLGMGENCIPKFSHFLIFVKKFCHSHKYCQNSYYFIVELSCLSYSPSLVGARSLHSVEWEL